MLALAVVLQRVGPGPMRCLDKVALEGAVVQHQGRVVEEMLRHGDLGSAQVQLDRIVVHLLDAVRRQVGHQAHD